MAENDTDPYDSQIVKRLPKVVQPVAFQPLVTTIEGYLGWTKIISNPDLLYATID